LQRESSSAFASHLNKNYEPRSKDKMQNLETMQVHNAFSHEKFSSSLQMEPRFFISGHR